MKTIAIIAIAVVISVVTTISVLVGLELFAVYQIEQAIEKIEREQAEAEAQIKAAELEKESQRKMAELEKQNRLASYVKFSESDIRTEYWNCVDNSIYERGYCNVILNDMVNVYCINLPSEIKLDKTSLCISQTRKSIIQNDDYTFEKALEYENNKQLFYEVTDDCRFDKGLSPYIENPDTIKCICDYDEILFSEWKKICDIR